LPTFPKISRKISLFCNFDALCHSFISFLSYFAKFYKNPLQKKKKTVKYYIRRIIQSQTEKMLPKTGFIPCIARKWPQKAEKKFALLLLFSL